VYYSFTASPDTSSPVIITTPLGNTPRSAWPVSVTANVIDNIGIDSVWVKWYKNTPSTLKEFKLLPVGANNYSAAFNSTQADVNVNDSIYYKIFAQDAGSNHLKDSTALYSFKIISQVNACIGTGTTSSNYPFTTYWEDGRTDILFTAAELTGAGGAAGNILSIAFDVISVGGPQMDGFNIKLQNTTATSISAFTNSGWTVCFNGSYSIANTGLQTITLTTPYLWNGTSNLLLEVCYNNAAWTAYSPVNSTPATGMMVGYSTDLPAGDGCTAAWTATSLAYRANVCMTINTNLIGIGNNTTILPGSYSLFQNYPNPFNPVTQIKYDLPKQGFVTLKIYDVLGREISRLVNEVKSPGSYMVDFDGTNLASGVYFYKLEVNNYTNIKKMMLIK
jgi:hypothetical protein